jgi:type IV pilus assembly protein PilA
MTRPKLIGLLIVIPIALLAAAILIPCMIPAHGLANESSAVASLRAIDNAEETYRNTYGGYADSLANLGGPQSCTPSAATACLIDQVIASGVKSGYRFSAVGTKAVKGANSSYLAGAAPAVFGRGERRFCATEKHVVRVDLNPGRPPDAQQCAAFSVLAP